MKAYSLHIGLNRVDPFAYGGWGGTLYGCHNDADAMLDLALSLRYDVCSKLLSEEATVKRVSDAIYNLTKQAVSGDIVFITYSGHGGQIEDLNRDESDGLDETWVFYDGMWSDDEFHNLLATFAKGVRVVVLSDSCHSGTMLKVSMLNGRPTFVTLKTSSRIPKAAPPSACLAAGAHTKKLLVKKKRVKASVILISGCADNQYSYDGDVNGLFTQTLLEVWNSAFPGGYNTLRKAIVRNMPPDQTPQIMYLGSRNKVFENATPFKP